MNYFILPIRISFIIKHIYFIKNSLRILKIILYVYTHDILLEKKWS